METDDESLLDVGDVICGFINSTGSLHNGVRRSITPEMNGSRPPKFGTVATDDKKKSSGSPCSSSVSILPSSQDSQSSHPQSQQSSPDREDFDPEKVEIPESPDCHEDSVIRSRVGANFSQPDVNPAQRTQELRQSSNDAVGLLISSQQPDTFPEQSTPQLLETVVQYTSREGSLAQRSDYLRQISLSVGCEDIGVAKHTDIQDMEIFKVEGERTTALGLEYLCVGRAWVQSGSGIPQGLVRAYNNRKTAREKRIATLRSRELLRSRQSVQRW